MDPIHPIRPEREQPAAIEAIRRVTRWGDDPTPERRPPRKPPKPAAERPSQPPIGTDGHLDARA